MQARKLYIDTQSRAFVASADSTLAVSDPTLFSEDVERINLFFLEPTGEFSTPYTYVDYSGNTVKLAVGVTAPAALQITWTAITTSIAATITTLVTGGSGINEIQRITFSAAPATGGFAVQLPARNVTVSSVTANAFIAADHGLYSGLSVTLTAFSFTNSTAANGSAYFVIRNSKDAFSLGATASATTGITAAVTSGGGTVTLGALTTGQVAYNAAPSDLQAALVASGLAINSQPQIVVTGARGKEYQLTFAGGSSNRAHGQVTLVANTLAGAAGLSANLTLDTFEMNALLAAGVSEATLEVEVSDGTIRQTFQKGVTLSDDIIVSGSAVPTPGNATSRTMTAPDGSVWQETIDNSGVTSWAKL